MINKKEKIVSLIIVVLIVGALFAINSTIYQINPSRCNGCRNCLYACDANAITYNSSTHKCVINPDLCEGCGDCVDYCNRNAIYETVLSNDVVTPNSLIKLSAYPNPVKTESKIEYRLPINQKNAIIRIVNVKGKVIDQFAVSQSSGQITWNRSDQPSGVYFAQMISGKERLTKKIMVIE